MINQGCADALADFAEEGIEAALGAGTCRCRQAGRCKGRHWGHAKLSVVRGGVTRVAFEPGREAS